LDSFKCVFWLRIERIAIYGMPLVENNNALIDGEVKGDFLKKSTLRDLKITIVT
jgi:hypothetical protein